MGEDGLKNWYTLHATGIRNRLRRGFLRSGRYANVLNGDDIEDAIQDAFARAINKQAQYPSGSKWAEPGGYLFAAARNVLISTLRRRLRERWLSERAGATSWNTVDAHEMVGSRENRADLQRVADCLANLPCELYAIFQARFIAEQSQQQAAESLRVTRRRIRTLERRLLERVAKHIR